MNSEKMMVLKMLEERKITSDEAAKLLQSLETGTPLPTGSIPPSPASPPPMPSGPPPASYTSGVANANNGPAPSRPAPAAYPSAPHAPAGPSRVEEIANDLGRKFEGFARNMEPKLQKFTESVASHIVTGADKLSKSFSDATASRPTPPPAYQPARPAPAPSYAPAASASGLIEKAIELSITEGYNELNLSGLNGDIRIKGFNGDKITARVSYKALRHGASIDLMKLGSKYYLKYDQDDFEKVSIDAYVPERLFQVVKIDNINGQVDISSLASNQMEISNGNGHMRLAGIAAETLKAENSQGRLILLNVAANNAVIENVNGVVEAEETDIANFKLTNYNGALTLLMSNFARYDSYVWGIETGNAKLTMTLPTMPDLGYHVKAHTTLGEIRLGLTGLQFLINDPSLAEARSVHFDGAAKKVRLTAETSNGPLMIN